MVRRSGARDPLRRERLDVWHAPDDAWRRARSIVLRTGWNPVAYQILNPGMSLWFSAAGDAVAGYAAFAGTRVVAGAPVCEESRLADVARELEADAERAGERVIFFGAGTRLERVYARDADHSLLPLGAMPVWDPQRWPDVVRKHASLRAQLHRAANKGIRVRELEVREGRAVAALRPVLAEWLATRGLPPLAFLTTPDLLDRLGDRRVFVAERRGRGSIVAFLVATPVPARQGWLVEQWPRASDAPNGTTHLLVDGAMRALAASGARYVTLGLAPLAPRGGTVGPEHPAWLRAMLHWLHAHGRRFYNFAGLEAFKSSLRPERWEPVLAIAPGGRFTMRSLRAVAGAFSGGAPEWLVARALASAVVAELRGLAR